MLNFLFTWKGYFSLLILGLCGYFAHPYLDKAAAESHLIENLNILVMATVMGIAIYLVLAIWVVIFKSLRHSK